MEIGQPGSGTRPNAEAVLAASGVALADLAEVKETGLAEGLRMLAAGEVDAVITTLAAPAYSLQQAAAGTGIKLISIGTQERAILAGAHPDLVPVTLPPNTYPGQTDSVETVAATALLVATAAMPDSTVETIMGELFGGIDFVAAGSTAGIADRQGQRAHGPDAAAAPGGRAVPAPHHGHAVGSGAWTTRFASARRWSPRPPSRKGCSAAIPCSRASSTWAGCARQSVPCARASPITSRTPSPPRPGAWRASCGRCASRAWPARWRARVSWPRPWLRAFPPS